MRRLSAFDEKFSRSAGVPGARDRSGKRWKSSEYGFLRESLTESREAIRRSRSRSDRPESSRDRGRLRIADNRNGSYNSTFSVGNSLNPDLRQAARRFGCGASNFSIHSSGTIFAGAWLLGTPRRYHTRSPPRHPERRLVAKLVALSPRAIRRFFSSPAARCHSAFRRLVLWIPTFSKDRHPFFGSAQRRAAKERAPTLFLSFYSTTESKSFPLLHRRKEPRNRPPYREPLFPDSCFSTPPRGPSISDSTPFFRFAKKNCTGNYKGIYYIFIVEVTVN